MSDVAVAVIGAGVAGLAAAVECRARGAAVAVLEAGPRPGGVMQTDALEGFRVERGPSAFQVKAPAADFVRRHGLGSLLVRAGPEARLRFFFRNGALCPVPSSPLGALRTPLLGTGGKLRLLAEPFVRRGDPTGESVAEFVSRRLGAAALEGLVGPFLVGVYAGDPARLGVEAVFPALVEAERAHGSIVRHALRSLSPRPAGPRPLPGSYSAVGGLGALAGALAERAGGALETGRCVVEVRPDAGGWRIVCEGGEERTARAVVLATPAHRAAPLLAPLEPEAAKILGGIEYAPMVSVSLGLAAGATAHPLRGFGLLVPAGEGLELLGALFMSRVFPGRAPAGHELVTAMIGGARWPGAVEAADGAVLERVGRGLEATLGLRDLPAPLALRRWPHAVPQPDRDHPRRVLRLRELAARHPGLVLAGGYLDGVSVADALASGVRAAEHALAQPGVGAEAP